MSAKEVISMNQKRILTKFTLCSLILLFFLTGLCAAQAEQSGIKGITYYKDAGTVYFNVFFKAVQTPVELVALQNGESITQDTLRTFHSFHLPYKGCASVLVSAKSLSGATYRFSMLNEQYKEVGNSVVMVEGKKYKDGSIFIEPMDFRPRLIEETSVRNLDYDFNEKEFAMSLDVATKDAPVSLRISGVDGKNFCYILFASAGEYTNVRIPLSMDGRDELVSIYNDRGIEVENTAFGFYKQDPDYYPHIDRPQLGDM